MARSHVEKFLQDYATNTTVQSDYNSNRSAALKKHAPGLSDDEHALLVRGDSHEIRTHLKDSYAAALSVNIP